MASRVEVAQRFGLVNVTAIEQAAEMAGLPFAVACALMEKESGGRNIYGHDAGGAGPHGQPVTEANYRAFIKAVLNGATSNGVGPAQITYAGPLVGGKRDGGFFRIMQGRGLKPWLPVDNMRFGFELLAGYHAATGSWVTAGERYNGARSYGEDLAKKIGEWRKRLERVAPDLRVLAWNSHMGNTASRICNTLTDETKRDRPRVIVLNEVRRHRTELGVWAREHGYEHFQEKPLPEVAGKPVPEQGSTAVLIDSDLNVLSARVVAMRQPWTVFSHQRQHAPRRGWQIRFRHGQARFKGRFVHGPTNGFTGGNRTAFAEFARLMQEALVNKATGTLSFAVSDHNERLRPLRKWARLFGATVAGHSVDSCVVVGGAVTAETHGKHGSDHELIRYTIRRK